MTTLMSDKTFEDNIIFVYCTDPSVSFRNKWGFFNFFKMWTVQ